MKHLKLTLFLCSFILVATISCKKENSNRPVDTGLSEPRPGTNISIDSLSNFSSDIPGDQYNDLTFINDSTGYAVSLQGRIVKTSNAGKNWVQLNSPTTLPLQAVQFIDEKTGFIIGGDNHSGIFLKTMDGGETWIKQVLNTTESPMDLCFLDGSIGYIAGSNLLIKTEDGGLSWHSMKNSTVRIYCGIKFKNFNEGIATSLNGIYLKTTDGGNTWDSIKSITNYHLYQIAYTTYKIFIRADGLLVDISSNNQESIIQLPYVGRRMLFLNEYQAVGIGQHYNQQGYFPYGDIFITNDTWAHFEKKTYSPSDAFVFTAIAKMSAKKIMILGNGFNITKMIILNI
ncbi:MAG: YCF48-related protein [Prolixibacteraceae bacterium]|jgi:hypothetical protein|nr:YCF48-related protein [Prolixibacteraceae bacterium]